MSGLTFSATGHSLAIEKHFDVLRRCTDISPNVIDRLRVDGVLNQNQEAQLIETTSPQERIRLLLCDWLRDNEDVSKYETFLRTMERNDIGQHHVTNLLRGNTREDSTKVPMSESRYTRLVRIRPTIVNAISGLHIDKELLNQLKNSSAISDSQYEEIERQRLEHKRSHLLVSAVMRRSNEAFDLFKQALIDAKQFHLAAYLDEGEMISVHVNTTLADRNSDLSDAFNEAVTSESQDPLLSQLSRFDLSPVVVRPERNHINVLIFCQKIKTMKTFIEIYDSGELEKTLSSILNQLLSKLEPDKNCDGFQVKISIDKEEIYALEEATGIEGMEGICQNQISKHLEFLAERIDCSFALLFRLHAIGSLSDAELHEIGKRNGETDRNRSLLGYMLKKETTVAFMEALKQAGQRHLVNYVISDGAFEPWFGGDWPLTEKEIQVLDSNFKELVDVLGIDELSSKLCSDKIISNRQQEFVDSRTSSAEKTEVLLEILRGNSVERYTDIDRCLQNTKRRRIEDQDGIRSVSSSLSKDFTLIYSRLPQNSPDSGVPSVDQSTEQRSSSALKSVSSLLSDHRMSRRSTRPPNEETIRQFLRPLYDSQRIQ